MNVAMDAETSTRVVFVLGRRTRVGAREIDAVAADASEVVLLSLGYPVSRAQRRAVETALAAAVHWNVTVDATLVVNGAELAGAIGSSDRVIVTGSRRERSRLRRRLART